MSAAVSLKRNWMTTTMYQKNMVVCVCLLMTYGHALEKIAFHSRRLSDLRFWLLRSPFEHSAGRFQEASCLLWFRYMFLGTGLIAQWEPALSLNHCRGNWHKGKRGYSLPLPWYSSVKQSSSMFLPLCGVPKNLLWPVRRGRKASLQQQYFANLIN